VFEPLVWEPKCSSSAKRAVQAARRFYSFVPRQLCKCSQRGSERERVAIERSANGDAEGPAIIKFGHDNDHSAHVARQRHTAPGSEAACCFAVHSGYVRGSTLYAVTVPVPRPVTLRLAVVP
jgi:hypothetical protein